MSGSAAVHANRRHVLALAAGALVLPAARAAGEGLPVPHSLAGELRTALAKQRALVLMVSLEGCPFCKVVRQNYLMPLAAQGQPVVQIDMGSPAPLVDLKGAASNQDRVIRTLGVKVAPTVLFLGPEGREAAPRLDGVPLLDFYGAYLDDRLATANRAAGART